MRLISRPPSSRALATNNPAGCLSRLGGSIAAMITPFRNGLIDQETLSRLCERQVQRGSGALVVCGSTGEATSLSLHEYTRVIEVAVEAAANRVPIIAGCGAPATEAATVLAATAARSGVGALLCAPPPYSKPTQEGILAHVRGVAHAADRPVVLYDVPSRTGVSIAEETVAQLFDCGLIAAIKDAAGDLSRPVRLRELCGDEFLQFSGDDATAAAYRAMGGDGCISVTANLAPALCASMHRSWDEYDIAEFSRVRDLLAPLHRCLLQESNPIPIKAALCQAGLCEGELRLPLTRACKKTLEQLIPLLPSILVADDAAAGLPCLTLVS